MRGMLIALAALASSAAAAQEPAPDEVRVDAGVSLLWGHGTGTYGFGGVVEAKYHPLDRVGVGLRLEGGVRGGGRAAVGSSAVQLATGLAVLGKGEVFLTRGAVRPFLGAGAGLYTLRGQSAASGTGASVDSGRWFGVAPQVGVDFGTWRVGATYNALFGAEAEVQGAAGEPLRRVSRNYLGLDVTFVAWRLPRALTAP